MSFTSFVSQRFFKSGRSDRFVSLITVVSVIGVMLGTAALIITLSVLGGFEEEITGKVIGFNSHIQVQGFQNQPLQDPNETISILREGIPLIRNVIPFVSREAIIRSREGVDGIMLKGVPAEGRVRSVRKYIVEGSGSLTSEPGQLPPLIIGRKLARRLALGVGDKAAVFGLASPDGSWQPRVMQFRVGGVYESGMAEYDDVIGYASMADVQRLLRLGGDVSGYDVLLTEIDSAAAVADEIERLLGYPHYARTVFQSYRNYFSWIELQTRLDPIIIGLIIPVAAVNIIGTLLMMVLGKTKEIGILLALGSPRFSIARIFLRQGFVLSIIGTFLGNVVAFLLLFLQKQLNLLSLPSDVYFMSSVPVMFRWEYFAAVSAISVALALLCSFLPARLASRVEPVRAIRFS